MLGEFSGVNLILWLLGCAAPVGDNLVQDPSEAAPGWFVSIAADGFVPSCKAIDAGDTVQWENKQPNVPANVTSLEEPLELYSPNMQGEYVTWAHTFASTGLYEYYDTNSGDPGRKVVDAYYGSVTYVGVSASTSLGAICVNTDEAESPCCCTSLDCGVGESCVLNTCTSD